MRSSKRLRKEGWVRTSVTGSHWTFKHPDWFNIVTVPHPRKDLGKGLQRTIFKGAGW